MTKIFYILLGFSSLFFTEAFAASSTNILGLDNDKLRNGEISFEDIPKAIQSATSFVLGFSSTIAVIMIIVGGLRYSLGSIEGSSPNKTKAQDTIKYGITGMVISVSAWFIVNLIIKNL